MPNNQQRRRAYIGIILGGGISSGSVVVAVLGIIYRFIDASTSVIIAIPGAITGIVIGGFIGDFAGAIGAIFIVSGLLGILPIFIKITPENVYGFLNGLNSTTSGLSGSAVSVISFIAIVRFAIGKITTFGNPDSNWRADKNLSVTLASHLLPSRVRDEHVEEWRAWLRDLRISGEPWHCRLLELLSIILIAVPKLAITHRLRRRRAVD